MIADRVPDISRAVTVIEALLRGLDLANRDLANRDLASRDLASRGTTGGRS